jgi:hypothetical protein
LNFFLFFALYYVDEEDRFEYLPHVWQGLPGEQQPSALPELPQEGDPLPGSAREDAAQPSLLPED